jgi:hypothetical protein
LPASDLGQAIDYTRKRWRQLRRYLDLGWLPIDNVYASWCTFGEGSLWDLAA